MKCPSCNRDETKPTTHTEFPRIATNDQFSDTGGSSGVKTVIKGPCGPLKTLVMSITAGAEGEEPFTGTEKGRLCGNCLQKMMVEVQQGLKSIGSLIPQPSDED